MVRLVFRPYTQILRSICTSEPLRASTRVSPGFALFRHSSPSFGSRHKCSHSNLEAVAKWSVDGAAEASDHHFHCAPWFATTILASVSDSLVRVTRRDKEHHFLTLGTAQSASFPPGNDDSERTIMHKRHPRKEAPTCTKPALVTFGSLSAISGTI